MLPVQLLELDLDTVDQVEFQDRISIVQTICNVNLANLHQINYNDEFKEANVEVELH